MDVDGFTVGDTVEPNLNAHVYEDDPYCNVAGLQGTVVGLRPPSALAITVEWGKPIMYKVNHSTDELIKVERCVLWT